MYKWELMIDAYSVHKDLEVTVTSALDTKGVQCKISAFKQKSCMLWDDYLFIVKTEKVHDISAKWITPKAWLGSFKPGVLHFYVTFQALWLIVTVE